jgi:predicted ribosomally synthesized peptide with SipW-like signal peptide
MRKWMTMSAIITMMAVAVGLIGWGVSAQFTDSAHASATIAVGTFGINISSTTPGAVVSNSNHTVTYTAPTIQSSAAGSAGLSFTVTTTGSMPAHVVVSSDGGSPALTAPWSDLFANPGPKDIAGNGGSLTYTGGIGWSELGNADLGSSRSVTYTVTATN